jgi:hypothetical protein
MAPPDRWFQNRKPGLAGVFGGVMLSGLFGVVGGVGQVPVGNVGVMTGLHVVAGLVMLGRFAVVFGRVFVMLRRLLMVRSTFMIIHGYGSP